MYLQHRTWHSYAVEKSTLTVFLFHRKEGKITKMVYGYARVSSTEQNLDRQILALREYVPKENIVVDKASGKDTEREGYRALKGRLGLREGDTLYVTSLDRLSRNKEDIKIRLKILDLPTSLVEVPEGQQWILEMIQNVLIEVLSSIAEQERLTIKRRQREGIEAAKKLGKHLGRPRLKVPDNFNEVYMSWKKGEITAKKAMEILNMKSSSFYRKVQEFENQ